MYIYMYMYIYSYMYICEFSCLKSRDTIVYTSHFNALYSTSLAWLLRKLPWLSAEGRDEATKL